MTSDKWDMTSITLNSGKPLTALLSVAANLEIALRQRLIRVTCLVKFYEGISFAHFIIFEVCADIVKLKWAYVYLKIEFSFRGGSRYTINLSS